MQRQSSLTGDEKVREIYGEALKRPTAERMSYVAARAADDPALRRLIELMLAQSNATALHSEPARRRSINQDVSAGTIIGAYQIEGVLGAGGMGVVFRARDRRLDRAVAIKFLADDLVDRDASRRFQDEARLASGLNHPHILTVFDTGTFGVYEYLVTEYVDGPTLRDWARHNRGWRKTVELLLGVADALAAAHAAGILHRDVKPENILVANGDYAKLADFGLAKLAAGVEPLEPRTRTGMIIGTVAYMSPEQAAGLPVDERSDIFSFGIVLYEMLAGRRPFAGATDLELIRSVVHGTAIPLEIEIPPRLRDIVEKALAQDPAERYQTMRDLVVDLKRVLRSADERAGRAAVGAHPRATWRRRVAAIGLGAAMVAAGYFARDVAPSLRVASAIAAASPVTRLDVQTPATRDPLSFALSPDGSELVFVAQGAEGSQLFRRPLAEDVAQPLAGTAGASFPFWAPDGRAIAFFADGKLKRLDLGGGSPRALAEAPSARGGTWSRDGTILFAPSITGGLMRVAAAGGISAAVTSRAAGEGSHRFPFFLSDGRRFLYLVGQSRADVQGVYLGSLDGGTGDRLAAADFAAEYVPGFVLMVREGVLNALPFDEARGTIVGSAVPIGSAGGVVGTGRAAFSASSAGLIAYRTDATIRQQLAWIDRGGTTSSSLGSVAGPVEFPELDSDDQRVAVEATVEGNTDVWLVDARNGVTDRFTLDPSSDGAPAWAPGGSAVVFRSNRNGSFDLLVKPTGGEREEAVLLASSTPKFPADWSPDGRMLLYVNQDETTGSDLWALPLQDTAAPFPVVQTRFAEDQGQFSPDGRWIAYRSNESERLEVYVRPFPGPGGARRVSVDGGGQPRWRRDGKELFYVAANDNLMAVPIGERENTATLDIGTPIALFSTRLAGPGLPKQQYAVARDGQRFLMNVIAEQSSSYVTVVQNWMALLPE